MCNIILTTFSQINHPYNFTKSVCKKDNHQSKYPKIYPNKLGNCLYSIKTALGTSMKLRTFLKRHLVTLHVYYKLGCIRIILKKNYKCFVRNDISRRRSPKIWRFQKVSHLLKNNSDLNRFSFNSFIYSLFDFNSRRLFFKTKL